MNSEELSKLARMQCIPKSSYKELRTNDSVGDLAANTPLRLLNFHIFIVVNTNT